jgi:hypothetical protein
MNHENTSHSNRGGQSSGVPNLFRSSEIAQIEEESLKARKAPTKRFVSFCIKTLTHKFTGWCKHPVASTKQTVQSVRNKLSTPAVQQEFPLGD